MLVLLVKQGILGKRSQTKMFGTGNIFVETDNQESEKVLVRCCGILSTGGQCNTLFDPLDPALLEILAKQFESIAQPQPQPQPQHAAAAASSGVRENSNSPMTPTIANCMTAAEFASATDEDGDDEAGDDEAGNVKASGHGSFDCTSCGHGSCEYEVVHAKNEAASASTGNEAANASTGNEPEEHGAPEYRISTIQEYTDFVAQRHRVLMQQKYGMDIYTYCTDPECDMHKTGFFVPEILKRRLEGAPKDDSIRGFHTQCPKCNKCWWFFNFYENDKRRNDGEMESEIQR
jgi:hypothetical protein